MSKKKDTWAQIRRNLQAQLPAQQFHTWFSQIHLEVLNPDLAVLQVPHKFIAHWLRERYYPHIKASFERVLNYCPELHFTYGRGREAPEPHFKDPSGARELHLDHELNSAFTFKRFYVGDYNRFAHSSALAVASRSPNHYNPFYIFSPLGLGKTHLLHAIGNHAKCKNPFLRIRYVSCDSFTKGFTYAVKHRSLSQFRDDYASLDLLLFDDVQMLGNRKRTQQEFLFLFNSLHGEKKQMVISADRPPNQLTRIDARLRSRLGSGLICGLETPDQNSKVRILRQMAEQDKLSIPDDIIFFLAKSNKDIKGLVKNIIRIKTYISLNRGDLNISTVKSLIKDNRKREVHVEEVKSITAGYFHISLSELTSNKKQRAYAYPRQIAMYLSRKYTGLSFKRIGEAFGQKDHSTVIYAVNRIQRDKDLKKEIREDLNRLRKLLS